MELQTVCCSLSFREHWAAKLATASSTSASILVLVQQMCCVEQHNQYPDGWVYLSQPSCQSQVPAKNHSDARRRKAWWWGESIRQDALHTSHYRWFDDSIAYFCLVKQIYYLCIHRLSGKICTFAHVSRIFFWRKQRNKKEAELQTWNSAFFYDVKKFTGQQYSYLYSNFIDFWLNSI